MKKIVSVVVVGVLLFSVGCSTAWLSNLDGYIKIAGPILIQILDIVSLAKGVPVDQALVAKINADQTAVTTLANSISNASAQNIQGTCQAFNVAVATFANDLSQIEQLGNIGPSTAGEIGAAVGIAQAAIAEVEAPIKACQAAPTNAAAKIVLRSAALRVKSPEDVVKRFNSVVDKKHRVYLHSLPVRVVTFGKVQ